MIIYKITNIINGKYYIGKDIKNDPKYLGSGIILERAIKKYGKVNFKKEILEHCNTLEELDKQEIYWIKHFNSTSRKIGYNIAVGGTGGNTFSNLSDSKKKERIEKFKKSIPLWMTDEYKKQRSEASKAMWTNPNHKKHMKKIMMGRKINWADKISSSIKNHWKTRNRIVSEEIKKNMSEKMTGKIFKLLTEEQEICIVNLYQTMGPKLIEQKTGISRYLIVKCLKRKGIYKKWQKGIGEKTKKLASISKCGKNNPRFKSK